jgi:hypothetical protein
VIQQQCAVATAMCFQQAALAWVSRVVCFGGCRCVLGAQGLSADGRFTCLCWMGTPVDSALWETAGLGGILRGDVEQPTRC